MANKFRVPLPPVVGYGKSVTATLDIPIGPRYHVIWLEATIEATTAPTLMMAFGDIKLKINGRQQRAFSAKQANAICGAYGQEYAATWADGDTAAKANILLGFFGPEGLGSTFAAPAATATAANAVKRVRFPIFLAEPWRKGYRQTDALALPTAWPGGKSLVASVQLEIGCGANLTNLTAYAEQDYMLGATDAAGNPALLVNKWNSFTIPASAAEVFVNTLPRNDPYSQISVFSTTQTVESCKVKVEGNLLMDANKGQIDGEHVGRGFNSLFNSTTRLDVVFDYDDDPNNSLPMVYGGKQVQDFQFIPTLSAGSTSITLICQNYGPLS